MSDTSVSEPSVFDRTQEDRERPISPARRLDDNIHKEEGLMAPARDDEQLAAPRHVRCPAPLDALHRRLIRPFEAVRAPIDLDDGVHVVLAEAGSRLHQMAADVVNLAYSRRYVDARGMVIDIASCADPRGLATRVLVAVRRVGLAGEAVVLGTLKIDHGDCLGFMDLFEMAGGRPWPHAIGGGPSQPAGEFGRMAFHPVLDAAPRATKQRILRSLYAEGLARFRESGVVALYFVLSPFVRLFAASAGIRSVPVTGAVLRTGAPVQALQRQFPRYWRPGTSPDAQPALYHAPWQLADQPPGESLRPLDATEEVARERGFSSGRTARHAPGAISSDGIERGGQIR